MPIALKLSGRTLARAGLIGALLLVTLVGYASRPAQPAALPGHPTSPDQDDSPASTLPLATALITHTIYLPVTLREAISGPDTLLRNGDFESGALSGWTASGAAATLDEAHTGQWSARVRYSGSGGSRLEQIVDTEVGRGYKLTGWIKIAEESGEDWGGFRFAAVSWDWQTTEQTAWLTRAALGKDWIKVSLAFTATTDLTRIQIGYFGGSGRRMTVYVDDLALFVKGSNLPPQIEAVTLTPSTLNSLPQEQQFQVIGDDLDGAITGVMWDFGDGTRALSPNGTHRAALPGRYVATVSIADDDGAVATKTLAWSATDSRFPGLIINTPSELESTTGNPTLTLSGNASGSGVQVRVSSDRGVLGSVSGTSNWSASIALQPGLNRILAQAVDANKRMVTAERLVRYVPSQPLGISNVSASAANVPRWDMIEITFALNNSAATSPQFPYDDAPAPGLGRLDGVTVDALFTPDNWRTAYRRPAFLNQRYQRALKGGQEWLYPIGAPVWTVRFAPPQTGSWKYRIEAREAKGLARSSDYAFTVGAPTNANNHGPIRVAPNDSRYFEFADGTPFLGTGHGIGFSNDSYAYDAVDTFNAIGDGNQQFFRWWVSGHLWGSAWYPWASRTLPYAGTVPATGLTLDRAYGNGLAALQLDEDNPIMFQGFETGHAGLTPGRTYRVVVRWRSEGVTGPTKSGRPFGATVKLTGWPEPGQTESIAAVVPHVNGDTPWHVATGDFVASGDFIPNVSLILENTTGGAAYVDEIAVYEVLSGGALGPQLLRSPKFNAHLTFDPRRSAGMDAIFGEAAKRGLYFKLVISEKQEYLLNHLGSGGLPDPNGNHFNAVGDTPTQALHEAHWRYLSARFGAYRSIHSWELVNEEAPGPGDHFQLTARLATLAAADGNPHLATTSTWATLAEEAWNDPASAPISYSDFHAYVRGTGWIEPKDELANDSARFFHEYDLDARAADFGKPVVWGEQGIDGTQGTDHQEPLLANDQNGVWLHKLTWARAGPGGVYPLYWYTDHIFDKSLHHIFGAWKRFMSGIPLTNGHYQDADATTTHGNLRVFGQKDMQAGRAHLWIDNQQQSWRAVVDRRSIQAVSGIVRLALGHPNTTVVATWYNTTTGQPSRTQTLITDAAGMLSLSVSNLATDTAVRIAPAQ
ncbi:MAG TPA: carbohydrate binding domain-containing protein [Anaerolineae bacterium]|nr:carbohydrate binding domain-containing protein [Anaerolineae bacterium]